MVIDHLVHSINDRDDPTLLYSPYIQGVDELLKIRFMQKLKGFRPRAFFIGGGGYSLPRAWANDYKMSDLINNLRIPIKKVAIELNQEIMDKKKISKIALKKDDKMEIVHFIGGG